jgi:hypothetical protein
MLGRRLGAFFLSIGVFSLLYFFLSISAGPVPAVFLLGGVGLVGLGILLLASHPAPPVDRGRFRIFRRKSAKKA